MKTLIFPVIAISALAFGEAQTSALSSIDGSLLIVGTGSASVSGGVTTVTPGSPMHVIIGVGDYSSVPSGSAVTVNPLQYTGNGIGASLQSPVTPEWTLTIGSITYSFDLTALVSASFIAGTSTTPNSVAVSGSGTAHIDGFLDTGATWSFSGTGTGFTFAVAAQQTTALENPLPPNSVPDGGSTLALLALATGGFAVTRRK